jgi:aldose 1-epimerase
VERIGTYEGQPVLQARLVSDTGVEVDVLSFGAIVRDWRVPDRAGVPRTVTLGFDTFEPYVANSRAFGALCGRVANRIRYGRFTLDGAQYQLDLNRGPDHIHGGSRGLGQQLWAMDADGRKAWLTLTSPDGDMGYPGTVRFAATITVEGNTVTFDLTAEPDRPTPVNLAQHSYYRLGGTVAEHVLTVAAHRVCDLDERFMPTGEIVDVTGTPLDFSVPRAIGVTEIDRNYCLDSGDPACVLEGLDYRLTLSTDRPGLQVYDAFNMPPVAVPGLGGVMYGPFSGIALEAQDWPDAVNHPAFPSIIATPDRPYRQTTRVTIVPR